MHIAKLESFLELWRKSEKPMVLMNNTSKLPTFEFLADKAIGSKEQQWVRYSVVNVLRADPVLGRVVRDPANNYHSGHLAWNHLSDGRTVCLASSKADLLRELELLKVDKNDLAKLKVMKAGELQEILDSSSIEDKEGDLVSLQLNIKKHHDSHSIKVEHPFFKTVKLSVEKQGQYHNGIHYKIEADVTKVLDATTEEAATVLEAATVEGWQDR